MPRFLNRWKTPAIIATVFVSTAACAQGGPELVDRLHRGSDLASLESITQKPWHLKLDVTVFDDAGKNPQQGTIEYWQSDSSTSRSLYTFGSSTHTILHIGRDKYVASTGDEIPDLAFDVLARILNPGVDSSEFKGSEPELRKQRIGGANLECIMLTQPAKSHNTVPLGLFPTYCFDSGKDLLRVSYNFGSETAIRNGTGDFLGQHVTTNLTLQGDAAIIATAKVTTLSTYTPEPDEFKPAEDMKLANTAHIGGGVIAGSKLNSVVPVYPSSARASHISGAVIMHAIIGRDGRIRSLRPISSPDPDLTISALDAVRRWIYKPYLLNGEPVEVDTTITVNYNLSY